MRVDEAIARILEGFDGEPWRTQVALKTLANHARLLSTVVDENDVEATQAGLVGLVERADRVRQINHVEDAILAELAAVGIDILRIDDLMKPGVGNANAVPVLLRSLHATDNVVFRWKLVRALGMPWSTQDAVQPLIDEFYRAGTAQDFSTTDLRNSIPQSIGNIADERWLEALLEVIHDPESGSARYFFIRALRKMRKRKDEVIPELMGFLSSSVGDLYIPAARLLGYWKVAEAAPRVRELLATIDERPAPPAPGAWARSFERDELRKALLALEKAESSQSKNS